jgi:two-component system response regulator AtoC
MTQNFPFRVLVVDDELLIRWSIAEMLKEHGHAAVEAESGAAALRALQTSSRIDAVVLDYCLPDTHDFSLLAEIRRIAPRTPVILMTASCTADVIDGALGLGVYDVIDNRSACTRWRPS